MSHVAGTTDSYVIKGQREDLQDAIFMLTPSDTPLTSTIGRTKATAVKHEWQTDSLAPPDITNAQIEGDDFAYSQRTPTSRVGNVCQISRKPILISGTAEEVNKAGRKSEMKFQAMKAGKEMKKDVEAIILSAQASAVGNSSTPRKLGGLAAWIVSNVSRGAGGANGGYNQGSGAVVAPTAGTPRGWIEPTVKDVQQAAFTSGGKPTIAMMPAPLKRQFSGFAGLAQQRRETGNKAATIVASADIYLGDFGELSAVPNRVMTDKRCLLIDPQMAKIAYLRPMKVVKPSQTGDAEKRVLLMEYTLEVSNEAGHGLIDDLQ